MHSPLFPIIIFGSIFLTGCADISYPLVFASKRTIGVEIEGPQPESPGTGNLILGYKSRNAAIVPLGTILSNKDGVQRRMILLNGCSFTDTSAGENGPNGLCDAQAFNGPGAVGIDTVGLRKTKLEAAGDVDGKAELAKKAPPKPPSIPSGSFSPGDEGVLQRIDSLSTFSSFAGSLGGEAGSEGIKGGISVEGEFFATGVAAQNISSGFEKQLASLPLTRANASASAYSDCLKRTKEATGKALESGEIKFCQTLVSTNQAPTAVADQFSTTIGTPLTKSEADGVLANDKDADNDNLVANLKAADSKNGGTITMQSNGAFTYTPASGFTGTDEFSYFAMDGKGGIATGVVTISVQ